MAKLKCDEHGRRIVAVDGVFIHRTGDGSKCSSPTAKIRDKTFFAKRPARVTGPASINIKFDAKLFEQQVNQAMRQMTEAFNNMVFNAAAATAPLKLLAQRFNTPDPTKIEEI